MPVSILSIPWQQLRTLSNVYFPFRKSTPRSPPNVSTARAGSTAWLSQRSSHRAGHKEGPNEVEINLAFSFSWGCCIQHEVFQEYFKIFGLF